MIARLLKFLHFDRFFSFSKMLTMSVFLIIFSVFMAGSIDELEEFDEVETIRTTKINSHINLEIGESFSVSKGTKLKILAVTDFVSDFEAPPLYLVETPKGERGYTSQANIDSKFICVDENRKFDVGDSITIKKIVTKGEELNYVVLNHQNGETQTLDDIHDFISLRGDKLFEQCKLNNNGEKLMTKSKFERKYMGEPIDNDLAYPLRIYGDTTVVCYGNIVVFDKELETAGTPEVKYVDNKAVSYSYKTTSSRNTNSWAFAMLPLSGFIVDSFGFLVNEGNYDSQFMEASKMNGKYSILFTVMGFSLLPLILFWLFLTPYALPSLLFGTLKYRPFFLKSINNRILFLILMLSTIIFTYIWYVLLVAYGFIWYISLPILFFTTRYFIRGYRDRLLDENPPYRCHKCRAIDAYDPAPHRDFVREYYTSNSVSQYRGTKKSYRDVDGVETITTKKIGAYGNEISSSTSQRNVSINKRFDTDTYEIFKNKYLVKVFVRDYTCEHCNTVIQIEEEEYIFIGSESQGYQTTTQMVD